MSFYLLKSKPENGITEVLNITTKLIKTQVWHITSFRFGVYLRNHENLCVQLQPFKNYIKWQFVIYVLMYCEVTW